MILALALTLEIICHEQCTDGQRVVVDKNGKVTVSDEVDCGEAFSNCADSESTSRSE